MSAAEIGSIVQVFLWTKLPTCSPASLDEWEKRMVRDQGQGQVARRVVLVPIQAELQQIVTFEEVTGGQAGMTDVDSVQTHASNLSLLDSRESVGATVLLWKWKVVAQRHMRLARWIAAVSEMHHLTFGQVKSPFVEGLSTLNSASLQS
jgi:hypothetical protein